MLIIVCLVNPFSKTHGSPQDAERHVGDLGNFKTDSEGNATGTVQDKLVKLIGAESVLGVSSFICLLFLLSFLWDELVLIRTIFYSVPWSSTLVLMTLAVVVTRSLRRLVMLVAALLAVSSWILGTETWYIIDGFFFHV